MLDGNADWAFGASRLAAIVVAVKPMFTMLRHRHTPAVMFGVPRRDKRPGNVPAPLPRRGFSFPDERHRLWLAGAPSVSAVGQERLRPVAAVSLWQEEFCALSITH